MSTPLITGQLHPCDGVPGCTLSVTPIRGSELVQVEIRSPHGHHEIVDRAEVKPEELGPWLLGRVDY